MPPQSERLRIPGAGGGAVALAVLALAVFAVLWWQVLVGQRVLLGGDVLYQLLPWAAEPGAHAPANILVDDPMLEVLPWQQQVAKQVAEGRLPLWNPIIQNGAPLLAKDQPAALSPFTWLALLFPAAVGLSLAMLAKILVAGLGMAAYLRALKASGLAATLAGIAFGVSSFMVVWLAWPASGVAAMLPWAFAFAEMYLDTRRAWALSALALTIGLQFFAGHAETSLDLGLALAIYVILRWAFSTRRWSTLVGLGVAAVAGTALAGIQLVPFLDLLRHSTLVTDRTTATYGFQHLGLSALTSWVFPNGVGNPGIDGLPGRLPNYNESTGFVGVTALVLSPIGAWWTWSRDRSVAIALVGVGAISAAIVYGPLTPLTGRLPVLGTSNNERLLLVICFCVAALGGLGLDGLLQGPARRSVPLLASAYWIGAAGLVAVILAGLVFALRGQGVDQLLPSVHGFIGFWLAAGAASFVAAMAFAASGLFGDSRRAAAAGLCALAVVEAALFAGPFNPREPLDAVPPPSPSLAWLQAHSVGQPVAALGSTLIPETASLYGLADVRGYEVLTDPRVRLFWSNADPGYSDKNLIMSLDRPGVDWLAAAGVAYVMMPAASSLPGAVTVYSENGVAIAAVPEPRPFAYAPSSVVSASGPDQAAAMLAQAPLGPVVVEGCCPVAGSAQVDSIARGSGVVYIEVTAADPATIVVQQSFQLGWVAQVDGQPAAILPANVMFQAVSVPAGHHTVTLDYRPSSVTLGAGLSAAGALAVILIVVVPLAVRRRARPG